MDEYVTALVKAFMRGRGGAVWKVWELRGFTKKGKKVVVTIEILDDVDTTCTRSWTEDWTGGGR